MTPSNLKKVPPENKLSFEEMRCNLISFMITLLVIWGLVSSHGLNHRPLTIHQLFEELSNTDPDGHLSVKRSNTREESYQTLKEAPSRKLNKVVVDESFRLRKRDQEAFVGTNNPEVLDTLVEQLKQNGIYAGPISRQLVSGLPNDIINDVNRRRPNAFRLKKTNDGFRQERRKENFRLKRGCPFHVMPNPNFLFGYRSRTR